MMSLIYMFSGANAVSVFEPLLANTLRVLESYGPPSSEARFAALSARRDDTSMFATPLRFRARAAWTPVSPAPTIKTVWPLSPPIPRSRRSTPIELTETLLWPIPVLRLAFLLVRSAWWNSFESRGETDEASPAARHPGSYRGDPGRVQHFGDSGRPRPVGGHCQVKALAGRVG